MTYRKLSFTEAIQSLKESLNSEIKEEREIAQSLLDQHYGYWGYNPTKTRGDFKDEKINEYKNYLSCERMG